MDTQMYGQMDRWKDRRKRGGQTGKQLDGIMRETDEQTNKEIKENGQKGSIGYEWSQFILNGVKLVESSRVWSKMVEQR